MGVTKANIEPPNWKPNPKQFYTCATSCGWNHSGVKDLILMKFKKTSSKDLTWIEFNQCLEWFETLTPNTVTTDRDKNTEDLFA